MNALVIRFLDWRINRAQRRLTALKIRSINLNRRLYDVNKNLDHLDKHVVLNRSRA